MLSVDVWSWDANFEAKMRWNSQTIDRYWSRSVLVMCMNLGVIFWGVISRGWFFRGDFWAKFTPEKSPPPTFAKVDSTLVKVGGGDFPGVIFGGWFSKVKKITPANFEKSWRGWFSKVKKITPSNFEKSWRGWFFYLVAISGCASRQGL